MTPSGYFLDKAEQCRRLAENLGTRDAAAVAVLNALGAEFEAQAIESAKHETDAIVESGRHGAAPGRRPDDER
jgi:hypothetical protein